VFCARSDMRASESALSIHPARLNRDSSWRESRFGDSFPPSGLAKPATGAEGALEIHSDFTFFHEQPCNKRSFGGLSSATLRGTACFPRRLPTQLQDIRSISPATDNRTLAPSCRLWRSSTSQGDIWSPSNSKSRRPSKD
jgi:hypothetical protein